MPEVVRLLHSHGGLQGLLKSRVDQRARQELVTPPDNVEFVRLAAYSAELDPLERWFQQFRDELSNRAFETVELVQEGLGQALLPYWENSARLRGLSGFCWRVDAVDAL